jgi:hypothetical protein
MDEVATVSNATPDAPEAIVNAIIIKIANGFLVSPGMYVGDIERVYTPDIDTATAKVKEFLS